LAKIASARPFWVWALSGPDEGEVKGHVNGQPVYHASLSLEGYKAILEKLDMEVLRFIANDPECDSASVLMIRKTI